MEKVHVLVDVGLYNNNSLHLQIIFAYIVSSKPQINLWNRQDGMIPFSADDKINTLEDTVIFPRSQSQWKVQQTYNQGSS